MLVRAFQISLPQKENRSEKRDERNQLHLQEHGRPLGKAWKVLLRKGLK